MKDNHTFRGSRFEETLRGQPGIYKMWVWNEEKRMYVDPRALPNSNQKPYRAKRRVRVLGESRQEAMSFDSLEEARAWRLTPSDPTRPTGSKYTMGQLIAEWREAHKPPRIRESTWEMYGKDVEHFRMFESVPVEALTPMDIDAWIKHVTDPAYPKNKSRVSYEREVQTLGKLLEWYRQYKYRFDYRSPVLDRHRKDSVFRVKPPKAGKAMTWEEFESFLEQLKQHHKPVYYYLAALQGLTGARIGEACGLMWKDVEFDQQILAIRRTVWWDHKSRKPHMSETTKTGETRDIVMVPRLQALLREWQGRSGPQIYIFHKDGELMKYRAIQSSYNKAFEALGLRYRSTHVLRHTFATLYATQTRNRIATQAVLGHASSGMTDRYAKPTMQAQWDSMGDFLVGQDRPAERVQ